MGRPLRVLALCVASVACAAAVGCGQKGPLYRAAPTATAPVPAPAASAASPAR